MAEKGYKKARDLGGIDNDKSIHKGLFNNHLKEPVPEYDLAECETKYNSKNNSWIILGRDRPGSKASGYGGKGHTQTGTIDLVVGIMGAYPREKIAGQKIFADKNFTSDSARIYISQKTDVDKNFNLVNGSIGTASARSAIGIKADHVRVIGREGIKLITRTDTKNSQGGDIKSTAGIDLIAGNDDTDLQPLAKGESLVAAMIRLVHHIEKLNGIVDGLLMTQLQFNSVLTGHFHISPFMGAPTTPSIPVVQSGLQTLMNHLKNTKVSLMTHRVNLKLYQASYLTISGDKWVLSRHNNVN